MVASERRGVDRKVDHKGRLDEVALDEVLPKLLDILAVQRVLDLDVHRLGQLLQLFDRGLRRDFNPGCRRKGLKHRDAIPVATEVIDGAVFELDLVRAEDIHGCVLNQRLSKVGDAVVVAVSLVCLEHCELRRVGAVGTFVSEVAVDLEDAVDAANNRTLQEQLWRDSQKQLGVEGVRVSLERAGRSSTVDGLQHRGLDLGERALVECLAQRLHNLGANLHDLAGAVANDQVEVAVANAKLFTELVVLVWHWANGLGGHAPIIGQHAQLAALRGDYLTGNKDVVAKVDEFFPLFEALFADLVEAQHGLKALAVAGLQRGKAKLAGVAQEDDSAGQRDSVTGRYVDIQVWVGGANLRNRVGDRQANRVCIAGCVEALALG